MCSHNTRSGKTMSENVMGFQSQLAALMEMLMKAVVCETTKLFESGVLRLRLEVASIRQENEELKARLRSSEKLDTRSRSQKCQKISTSEEGDPGVQLTISEEDNMTKLSPVVALKEEDSEVAFVLVKHEDPNAEECNAGVSIQNSEEKSSIQDMLREATVKKHMTHMTTCDDREELPYEVGGALAEGIVESVGENAACGDLIDRTSPTQGTDSVYSAGSLNMVTLEKKQEIQNCNCLKTEHFAKECNRQVDEYRTGGVSWRRARCNNQDDETVDGGLLFPWATAQDAELQCTSYTEEGTPLRTPARSLYSQNISENFGYKSPKGVPPSTQSLDLMNKTVVPTLGVINFDAQKRDEYACILNRENCSGEIVDKPQVQADGLLCQCSECGRLFSSTAALEAHQSVHTGERPYSCRSCGKAFPSLRGLNRHSRTHTAERQYQCLQCGKSFVYQFSLTKHQLIHSGERAHICKVCDKSFVFKSDLTIHMRKHTGETPYGCGVCGKRFKHRRTLNMHLQGHTGEKRHVCAHCGKSFLDLGNFKRHKRIHTGEKPYSCQVCGKSFTQSAHLKKHFLTHR